MPLVSQPEIEPTPGQWKPRVLTAGLPGKSRTRVTCKATPVTALLSSLRLYYLLLPLIYLFLSRPQHSIPKWRARITQHEAVNGKQYTNIVNRNTQLLKSVLSANYPESFSYLAPLAGNALWKTHCLTWMGAGRHLDK